MVRDVLYCTIYIKYMQSTRDALTNNEDTGTVNKIMKIHIQYTR